MPNAAPPVVTGSRSLEMHAVQFRLGPTLDWTGLFSAVRMSRQLGESWSAHVEVRHLWTRTLHHNGPLRSGTISLSGGLVAAGISYRF